MDRTARADLPYMARAGYTTCLRCRRTFASLDVVNNRLCRGCTTQNARVGGVSVRHPRMPRPREHGFLITKGKR